MREGRLLTEESPSRLLAIYNTQTLEEVFLILSRRQEDGQLENLQPVEVAEEQNNSVIDSGQCTGSTVSVVSSVQGETQASTDVIIHYLFILHHF